MDGEPLDGKFSVDEAYGDGSVARLLRFVDDQDVPVPDAVALHAVAADAGKEGRGRVLDDQPVDVQGRAGNVLRGGGEAGVDGLEELDLRSFLGFGAVWSAAHCSV